MIFGILFLENYLMLNEERAYVEKSDLPNKSEFLFFGNSKSG